jgi:predicted Rossmann fold flavoprotein
MSHSPIIVIGAGGAGLIAAWRGAGKGAPVLLLERNGKAGIKILISGGGKCNVTHAGPMEEIRGAFLPREGRFLKAAFHSFTNEDLCELLRSRGVETAARENWRVFPVSNRAADVVGALEDLARSAGAEIRLRSRVTSIVAEGGSVRGVEVEGAFLPASQVILTTGGVSYRKTGTTGDGIAWARSLGHTIIPLRPALAPMRVSLPRAWQGISLRGGRLDVYAGGKKIDSWTGDILCTHEGLSGPAALEVSRAAAAAMEEGEVTLRYDFFPERDFASLDEALNAMILANRNRRLATLLEEWLPHRMVPGLLGQVRVSPDTRGHVLAREERRAAVGLLKSWEIGRVLGVDIDRGEVTSGGVLLDEVDPRTMGSRVVRGLYVAGEILDVAGPVGGYNLQAAFSTGYAAGTAAAAARAESISSA